MSQEQIKATNKEQNPMADQIRNTEKKARLLPDYSGGYEFSRSVENHSVFTIVGVDDHLISL
jgi:hypothetical protein